MPDTPSYRPEGVIPAALLPLNEDYALDERELRRHIAQIAGVQGVSAITVNGHASEVFSCTPDEQRRVLDVSLDEIAGAVPILSGVAADGSIEAARLAAMAQASGATGLLIFPPQSMILGGNLRPEMAIAHIKCIAEASNLPLVIFQFPLDTGMGYPFETLLRLVDEVPTIMAIKDLVSQPMLHERNIRVLQSLPRPVNVLTTHSSWLLGSLVMGAAGILSGSGSIIADRHVALFEAVRDEDLAQARSVNDSIYPLAQAFYAPPYLDNHNRMKHALKMLGRLRSTVVRPPLCPLSGEEIEHVRAALVQARMLDAERRPS